jgi:light-regulated signal transduction histidine kinase (bacteriophytochrome)
MVLERAKVLIAGSPIGYFEVRARHKDGSYRWIGWTAAGFAAEKLVYIFGREVTQRKLNEQKIEQLNLQLNQRVQELTEINNELEAFSYSISHDLRAPLRHIGGFVEMLRGDLGPALKENSRRHLDVISAAAKQMEQLIEDLLAFSRMSRTEIRRTQVNTDELVREVLRDLEPETRNRAIVWEIAPLPEVFADRSLLKQVWLNLLSNAIKYTRLRKRAEIHIRSVTGQREVEFVVQDNGAGFDMEYKGKLFGVFQRLHLAEEFEGTGIGLANVRRIVSRHGGKTWGEGQVNAGATFHFTIPRSSELPLLPGD